MLMKGLKKVKKIKREASSDEKTIEKINSAMNIDEDGNSPKLQYTHSTEKSEDGLEKQISIEKIKKEEKTGLIKLRQDSSKILLPGESELNLIQTKLEEELSQV